MTTRKAFLVEEGLVYCGEWQRWKGQESDPGTDGRAGSSSGGVREVGNGRGRRRGQKVVSKEGRGTRARERNGFVVLGGKHKEGVASWKVDDAYNGGGVNKGKQLEFCVSTKDKFTKEVFEFPSNVLQVCGAEVNGSSSWSASTEIVLFVFCEDAWVYALHFFVSVATGGHGGDSQVEVEVQYQPSQLQHYNAEAHVAKDSPTTMMCCVTDSGDCLLLIGKQSGNMSVLSLATDFSKDQEGAAGADIMGSSGWGEVKEPLMKRIFSGLTSAQDKSIIGIHILSTTTSSSGDLCVLVVHASGMVRLWQIHTSLKSFTLQAEMQAPAIQEDDGIDLIRSTLSGFEKYGARTEPGGFLLLSIHFSNPRKGTLGLLVMQMLHDNSKHELTLHKFGVLNLSSEYSVIRSVCGISMSLLCLVLQCGKSGEATIKTVQITQEGSIVLRDVKQRSNTLLGWIPLEASADFDPKAMLPWEGHKGAHGIETYVKERLLENNSVDFDAIALAMDEIGAAGDLGSKVVAASLSKSVQELFELIQRVIGDLAHQSGHKEPKVEHWLHFLRLYVRFWKQRHSPTSLGLLRTGSDGEDLILAIRSNGSIGILREAEDVDLFQFWNEHESPSLAQLRQAMSCTERLVGAWNKNFSVHLVCLGESPTKVADHVAKAAVQGNLFEKSTLTQADNVERARLGQRLKERRCHLFDLVSTILDIGDLEQVVHSFLDLISMRSGEGGELPQDMDTGRMAKEPSRILGNSLGSLLETLSLSRIELFMNLLITLHLYRFSSQSGAYSVAIRPVSQYCSLGLQSVKVVYLISSRRANSMRRGGMSVGTKRVRLLPGNKARKASAEDQVTYRLQPSLASTMASSKLWEWTSSGNPKQSLLQEALSFCESFGVHSSAGAAGQESVALLSSMMLKTTLCLYALGQTDIIHSILDTCERGISHTPEFRFIRGLGYCAQCAASEALAAEESFFSAVNGIEAGSMDLRQGIHQLKHELQGTTSGASVADFSRLDYYKTITLLFRRVGNLRGAVKFTLAAIAQVRNSSGEVGAEQEQGKLWTTLFELFLDLKMWNAAYVTIIANPVDSSSIAALHTLVITLFEADMVSCLCQLPLVGNRSTDRNSPSGEQMPVFYLSEVENALLWHCDHMSIDNGVNPYLPLYSFYTKLHKHRYAARVMMRYVRRLESGESTDFTIRDMKSHYRALLVAHNSLSLSKEEFRWVENADFVQHARNSESSKQAEEAEENQILTLEMIKCELITSRGRLLCSELSQDHSPSVLFFHKSPIEVFELLAKKGKYKLVTDLAEALPVDRQNEKDMLLDIVSRELARHCVSPVGQGIDSLDAVMSGSGSVAATSQFLGAPQDQSQPWGLLKDFLKRFDDRTCNYRLRLIVTDTLLTERRNICVPQWLLDSFKNDLIERKSFQGYADLLHILLKHELISDASGIAIEMLQTWKILLTDPRERQKSGAMCIPYNMLDALASKLETQHDHGLLEAKAGLEQAIQHHFASMRQESLMLTRKM
ncbi:hypothetical protein A3770_19p84430 [Chloropicon primus]|uniref:NUP160 middle TPR domain-containing protein n=5 Tax=Chloropicon primus TaxID=1764295 RepID=A0A5B8N238_9CHLO|nr:hypothetical protein A3770_19p84430 [Chloropicon primus]|eukprot:QDZ25925.1 hypothetical protein A3770_19p84430 [Chloropicon primus]